MKKEKGHKFFSLETSYWSVKHPFCLGFLLNSQSMRELCILKNSLKDLIALLQNKMKKIPEPPYEMLEPFNTYEKPFQLCRKCMNKICFFFFFQSFESSLHNSVKMNIFYSQI